MHALPESLIEEIEFWRNLLAETQETPESATYQRMLLALKLAEYRLDKLRKASGSVVTNDVWH
jgi:hypothetical protein